MTDSMGQAEKMADAKGEARSPWVGVRQQSGSSLLREIQSCRA